VCGWARLRQIGWEARRLSTCSFGDYYLAGRYGQACEDQLGPPAPEINRAGPTLARGTLHAPHTTLSICPGPGTQRQTLTLRESTPSHTARGSCSAALCSHFCCRNERGLQTRVYPVRPGLIRSGGEDPFSVPFNT
jgi:hypothetical protein